MERRQIIAIVIFVIMTIGIGLGLYFVFFRKEAPIFVGEPPTTTPSTSTFPSAQTGSLPPTRPAENVPSSGESTIRPGATGQGQGQFRQNDPGIVIRPVADVAIGTNSSNGQVRFYNATNGKFFTLGQNGNLRELSDQVFFGVDSVAWSPTQDETIIEYPDGANIYYNFSTKEQITLPRHWTDFSFSPDGGQIAAKSLGLSPENRFLIVSDPKGGGVQAVAELHNNADKVIVNWSPHGQVVALSRTGEAIGGDREEIIPVGLNRENFPAMPVEGRGISYQWSPTGDKILYSVFSARSDFKPELWVSNGSPEALGTGRRLLNINTWSEKCSFVSDSEVICAVPTNLQTGAGFAPDLAANSEDRLVVINLENGARSEISLDNRYTIESLLTDPEQRRVFFTDRNRSGIFETNL